MPALIRVGHRGAPAVAADNTLESFDAALAIGVDMIEFDVLAGRRQRGALFVAHDYGALTRHPPLTLETALAHFATPAFDGIRLQLDIKRRGYEGAVVDALDAAGLRERAFISTGVRGVLAQFRSLAPGLPLGWTVPDLPLINEVPTVGHLYRRRIPQRAAARIRSGAIDALVPHWSMVTAELVEAVRGAGGEIYTWTVNDATQIQRLAALGVTGVISNDPRLFGAIVQ
ncbi:MAG TPA: glycerophosphodiester phosphodiesterase [Solirubrobacteraceae bacterium]|jgi:glycerophosphoryl diester phosphodiesterase